MVKFTKIFRILTLAAIVSLLLVAIPASPALALDYDIELDPYEGEIGDRFYVRGDSWPASNYGVEPPTIREVDIYFSSQDADEGDVIGTASGDDVNIYEDLGSDDIDEDGEFSKRVTVPDELKDGRTDEDVHGGTYYVYVTMEGDDEIEAVAQFTLIAGEITLDTTAGIVGTEVEITGNYFVDREYITIDYDGDSIDIVSGDDRTDSGGGFESTILVPESTAGNHTIAVEDESGHKAEATFTVKPEMTISSNEGEAGDTVEVTGTGFGGGIYVDIMLDGTVAVTDITDANGSFTTSFEVDVEEGSYDIKVEDDDGNESEAEQFTVYIATSFSISPVTTQASPGHVGTDITVSGVGFNPNSQVTVTYATEPIEVATTVSDADGAFLATFKAPESVAGAHIITASDGTNSLTTTFYMESTPPLIPEPLLPEMGVKAETPVYFDWADVTDDSPPITYTLQIATDEDFTSDCMVLNKPDLTDSDYTITREEEKLEPRKKETPYYWRVKAIDGASNESDWSAPGSFYVGSRFVMPNGAKYALIAIGVGFLAFWLGRRTAFSRR